ncbi:MAG: ATP-binding cassette domain-containing protein [Candidatus Thiodiazotropha lotti]|uniref:peptidase domain-containing ABC transporter n=1 Tax=Candidatus Thiodiazotropha endoloripes TaxID=1818881 RepID=UPI0009F68244|nr:ABC transporter transmembrane domain-containing protein [Candidatus Thiodiazotropha endoloripes]MCG7899571.1 ATP-binding cassette domain-containing protein [Candidatus Thiodiazotropha weberae]MCG7904544.1 ATP-binding cassette domain-containing protein [Candidatus Thiodiazotropha weberae]MCG7998727.1 ATP-binding cassette domain-containing protein [Candidatus Thiodiazotropha lotti]MCW4190493.1 ABC transporter transmembrane domain-containing protein [Candidatus Thiodiazotropha weberae]
MTSSSGFTIPRGWRRPDVLLASLGINTLALAMPMVVLQVYDRIIPHQAMGTFMALMIGMLGVVVLEALLRIFRSAILAWSGARFEHRESMDAMHRVLHTDTLAFNRETSGDYLTRLQSVEEINQFYSGQSMLLLMDFPFVVLFLSLIWFISGELVQIPILLLTIFALISIMLGRQLHNALKARNTTDSRRQNFLIEVLSGIHTVKSMAMEALMLRRYERLQAQSAESIRKLAHINSVVQGFGSTFSQVAMVSFVSFGSLSVISGDLTVGALAAGTMLTGRVLQPGLKAMGLWTQFQSVRLSLDRRQEIDRMPAEISGEYDGPEPLHGDIKVEGIHFRYPGQEQWLLEDLSLEVPAGGSVGITGNNGTGKSTLISIMTGFMHPQQGEVLLDSRNIKTYRQEFLRQQIGFMPQHGMLYEGTILENMTLFREGEAIDQAMELSRELGLGEIIARMPDGLDTQIGGSAVNSLSEGVRQKIVMVRSLIGHPNIILFDDANANFDIKNDAKLMALIKKMKGSRTLVIVSHRPSFLRICDKQFELRDGQLHEQQQRKLKMVFKK